MKIDGIVKEPQEIEPLPENSFNISDLHTIHDIIRFLMLECGPKRLKEIAKEVKQELKEEKREAKEWAKRAKKWGKEEIALIENSE